MPTGQMKCPVCEKKTTRGSVYCSKEHEAVASVMGLVRGGPRSRKTSSPAVRWPPFPEKSKRVAVNPRDSPEAGEDDEDKLGAFGQSPAQERGPVTESELVAVTTMLFRYGPAPFYMEYVLNARVRLVANTLGFFQLTQDQFSSGDNPRYIITEDSLVPGGDDDRVVILKREEATGLLLPEWSHRKISTHPFTGRAWTPFDVLMYDFMMLDLQLLFYPGGILYPIFGRRSSGAGVVNLRGVTANASADLMADFVENISERGHNISLFVGYSRTFSYVYTRNLPQSVWMYANLLGVKELALYGLRGLTTISQPETSTFEVMNMPPEEDPSLELCSLCIGWCESLFSVDLLLCRGASIVVANCMNLKFMSTDGNIRLEQSLVYFAGVRQNLIENWEKSLTEGGGGINCDTLYLSNLYTVKEQKVKEGVFLSSFVSPDKIVFQSPTPAAETMLLHSMPRLRSVELAFPQLSAKIKKLHVEGCPDLQYLDVIRTLRVMYAFVTLTPQMFPDRPMTLWLDHVSFTISKFLEFESYLLPEEFRGMEWVVPNAMDTEYIAKTLERHEKAKNVKIVPSSKGGVRIQVYQPGTLQLVMTVVQLPDSSEAYQRVVASILMAKIGGTPVDEIHTSMPYQSVKPLSAISVAVQEEVDQYIIEGLEKLDVSLPQPTTSTRPPPATGALRGVKMNIGALVAHHLVSGRRGPPAEKSPAIEPLYIDVRNNTIPEFAGRAIVEKKAAYHAPFLGAADDLFVASSLVTSDIVMRPADPGESRGRRGRGGPGPSTSTGARVGANGRGRTASSVAIRRYVMPIRPIEPSNGDGSPSPDFKKINLVPIRTKPIATPKVDPMSVAERDADE